MGGIDILNSYGDSTPPQQDNTFKSIEATENLTINGQPYQNPVHPLGVSAWDAAGIAQPVYPDVSTSTLSLEQDRAQRSAGNTDLYRVAETFDGRLATDQALLVDGTARATAIYVPYRTTIKNILVILPTLNVGGTYTYIAWKMYGPLAYDASSGTTPLTALPAVYQFEAVNPLPGMRDGLIGSVGDLGGGLFRQDFTAIPLSPVYVEPGVYYIVQLLKASAAPGTSPQYLMHTPATVGNHNPSNSTYTITAASLAGLTTLPATLDLTAYTANTNARRQWFALETYSTWLV